MVVMRDEGRDRRLEFALQLVVFEQDAVLEGPVPALDCPASRKRQYKS
jgi:hypothetical protein